MENNKSHVQLPNDMCLSPGDQFIYLILRNHDKGNGCWPSLKRICKESGASINTVRASLKRLEETGWIKVIKDGRLHRYVFKKYTKFEPFSEEFLMNENLSFTEKAYLAASQKWMFKDMENIGKISMSNKSLSDKIHISERNIYRMNKSLVNKNYLTILKNESKDLETGCLTDTKIFKLAEFGQAIIWTLKNHEDRINENTENIEDLQDKYNDMKDKVESQQKLIEALLRAQNIEPDKFIV